MITINIDEKELKELIADKFKKGVKDILDDSILEYWIRSEVHKLLAKEVMDKTIKPMLTDEKINKLLSEAFRNYIDEKFDKHAME